MGEKSSRGGVGEFEKEVCGERVREIETEREREMAKETLMNADNKDPNLSSRPLETQRGFSLGQ